MSGESTLTHAAVSGVPGGIPLRIQVPGRSAVLVMAGGQHPVLGAVQTIATVAGEAISVVGAVDWEQPERIPPVAEPARLPPGAGSALLNVLATRARGPLRYRGPYPSAALYRSLSECFRPSASLEDFTRGGQEAAVRGRALEPPVDFAPAPFVRAERGRVCTQRRDGVLEAVFVDGRRFVAAPGSGRRLRDDGAGGHRAVLEIGGREALVVAALDAEGFAREPIVAPEPLEVGHLGRPLPDAVQRAIAATVIEWAPTLLRPTLRATLASGAIRWSDTGLATAAAEGDDIGVHAAFAACELPAAALILELAEAVAPVAFAVAQRRAAEAL